MNWLTRRGQAWFGKVRLGKARLTRPVIAWTVEASRGGERHGKEWLLWRGKARPGMARLCRARRGQARLLRLGPVWLGKAGRGLVRKGC